MYSDKQQNALKYLKNTEVNLNNILVITEDFNIRNNDWNLLYPYHLVHMNTLQEVVDNFGLEMLTPINPIPTQYIDNSQDLNLVLDLIFLQAELVEFNKHEISPDLWSSSYHTLLLVYIIIEEEFIQEKK